MGGLPIILKILEASKYAKIPGYCDTNFADIA
jgi:hypothetical protein